MANSLFKFEKINLSTTQYSVVASGRIVVDIHKLPIRGEVSASINMAETSGSWLLNRAIVQPEEARGHGLGTSLLLALLEELAKRPGFKCVIVEPGGYNVPVRRQRKFYTKNGFIPVPGHKGVYQWVRPKEEKHVTAKSEAPASA